MGTYTKGVVRRLVLFLVLYALILMYALILIATILFVFRISVDYAILAVALGSFTALLSAWMVLYDEILTDDEKSDNTEDKGSADEKPEEYREDETDLYDIIVNKPAETADEKPVDTDAATETPYGTAGTGAEDETDDKD